MIQAATEGIVDFTKMQVFDVFWLRQLKLLLAGLQRRNKREYHVFSQRHHASLLNLRLDSEHAGSVQEKLIELGLDFEETYFPGVRKERAISERAVVRHQIGSWERRYGDLTSEETQARIERTAEALRRMTAQTREVNKDRSVEAAMGLRKRKGSRNARRILRH